MVRHSRAKSTGKAHQNIDRRCENVLKAALLSHFDEPSQAPHGPSPKLTEQLQAVQAPIVRVVCASPSRPLKPRFSAIIISELAAKASLFTPAHTETRGFSEASCCSLSSWAVFNSPSFTPERLDPPGP